MIYLKNVKGLKSSILIIFRWNSCRHISKRCSFAALDWHDKTSRTNNNSNSFSERCICWLNPLFSDFPEERILSVDDMWKKTFFCKLLEKLAKSEFDETREQIIIHSWIEIVWWHNENMIYKMYFVLAHQQGSSFLIHRMRSLLKCKTVLISH